MRSQRSIFGTAGTAATGGGGAGGLATGGGAGGGDEGGAMRSISCSMSSPPYPCRGSCDGGSAIFAGASAPALVDSETCASMGCCALATSAGVIANATAAADAETQRRNDRIRTAHPGWREYMRHRTRLDAPIQATSAP